MKKKAKEKLFAWVTAIIFLTSMVMFGINFIPQKKKTVQLKTYYTRPLNADEMNEALMTRREVVTFYHPKSCCGNTRNYLIGAENYSSGAIILCDVTSNNRTIEFDSYLGSDYLNGTDVENTTKVSEYLCRYLVVKYLLPECVQ